MPNITLSLSDDLYQLIKSHKEISWSEIARNAMEKYAKRLLLLDSLEMKEKFEAINALLEDSQLTQDDVDSIDEKVKEALFKRLYE